MHVFCVVLRIYTEFMACTAVQNTISYGARITHYDTKTATQT